MKKILIVLVIALCSVAVATAQDKPVVNRRAPLAKSQILKTTIFKTDIDCPHCSKKILESLPFEKGVKDVKVDVPTKTVTVTYDSDKTNDENLKRSLTGIKVKVFDFHPQDAPRKASDLK